MPFTTEPARNKEGTHPKDSPSVGNSGSSVSSSSITPAAGTTTDKHPLEENVAHATTAASSSSTTSAAVVPDERAVWIHQRLRIRSSQNLVDVDLDVERAEHVNDGGGGGSDLAARLPRAAREGAAGAGSAAAAAARGGAGARGRQHHHMATRAGRKKKATAGRKVRVKTFDIRVEEYIEERRQVSGETCRESGMCPTPAAAHEGRLPLRGYMDQTHRWYQARRF